MYINNNNMEKNSTSRTKTIKNIGKKNKQLHRKTIKQEGGYKGECVNKTIKSQLYYRLNAKERQTQWKNAFFEVASRYIDIDIKKTLPNLSEHIKNNINDFLNNDLSDILNIWNSYFSDHPFDDDSVERSITYPMLKDSLTTVFNAIITNINRIINTANGTIPHPNIDSIINNMCIVVDGYIFNVSTSVMSTFKSHPPITPSEKNKELQKDSEIIYDEVNNVIKEAHDEGKISKQEYNNFQTEYNGYKESKKESLERERERQRQEAERKALDEAEALRVALEQEQEQERERERQRQEAERKALEEAEARRVALEQEQEQERERERKRQEAERKALEEAEALRVALEQKKQKGQELERQIQEAQRKLQEKAQARRVALEQEEQEIEKNRKEAERKALEEAEARRVALTLTANQSPPQPITSSVARGSPISGCPSASVNVKEECENIKEILDEGERRTVYKQQMLKLHPDKNVTCEDDAKKKFQEYNECYQNENAEATQMKELENPTNVNLNDFSNLRVNPQFIPFLNNQQNNPQKTPRFNETRTNPAVTTPATQNNNIRLLLTNQSQMQVTQPEPVAPATTTTTTTTTTAPAPPVTHPAPVEPTTQPQSALTTEPPQPATVSQQQVDQVQTQPSQSSSTTVTTEPPQPSPEQTTQQPQNEEEPIEEELEKEIETQKEKDAEDIAQLEETLKKEEETLKKENDNKMIKYYIDYIIKTIEILPDAKNKISEISDKVIEIIIDNIGSDVNTLQYVGSIIKKISEENDIATKRILTGNLIMVLIKIVVKSTKSTESAYDFLDKLCEAIQIEPFKNVEIYRKLKEIFEQQNKINPNIPVNYVWEDTLRIYNEKVKNPPVVDYYKFDNDCYLYYSCDGLIKFIIDNESSKNDIYESVIKLANIYSTALTWLNNDTADNKRLKKIEKYVIQTGGNGGEDSDEEIEDLDIITEVNIGMIRSVTVHILKTDITETTTSKYVDEIDNIWKTQIYPDVPVSSESQKQTQPTSIASGVPPQQRGFFSGWVDYFSGNPNPKKDVKTEENPLDFKNIYPNESSIISVESPLQNKLSPKPQHIENTIELGELHPEWPISGENPLNGQLINATIENQKKIVQTCRNTTINIEPHVFKIWNDAMKICSIVWNIPYATVVDKNNIYILASSITKSDQDKLNSLCQTVKTLTTIYVNVLCKILPSSENVLSKVIAILPNFRFGNPTNSTTDSTNAYDLIFSVTKYIQENYDGCNDTNEYAKGIGGI